MVFTGRVCVPKLVFGLVITSGNGCVLTGWGKHIDIVWTLCVCAAVENPVSVYSRYSSPADTPVKQMLHCVFVLMGSSLTPSPCGRFFSSSPLPLLWVFNVNSEVTENSVWPRFRDGLSSHDGSRLIPSWKYLLHPFWSRQSLNTKKG